MIIRPCEGKLVRTENAPFSELPVEGINVPDTSYYRRRLRDGDCSIVKTQQISKKATKKENDK